MSFLRNNAIPSLRNFAAGFFSLPTVSSLEGFFLRLLFGVVVASTLSLQVPFHDQPHPVGLARFFDLTWLSDPEKLSAYRGRPLPIASRLCVRLVSPHCSSPARGWLQPDVHSL